MPFLPTENTPLEPCPMTLPIHLCHFTCNQTMKVTELSLDNNSPLLSLDNNSPRHCTASTICSTKALVFLVRCI